MDRKTTNILEFIPSLSQIYLLVKENTCMDQILVYEGVTLGKIKFSWTDERQREEFKIIYGGTVSTITDLWMCILRNNS